MYGSPSVSKDELQKTSCLQKTMLGSISSWHAYFGQSIMVHSYFPQGQEKSPIVSLMVIRNKYALPSVSLSNWFSISVHQRTLNSSRRTTSPPESCRKINHTDVSTLCYVTAALKLHIFLVVFVAPI